jgi:hypothetical protein
MAKFYFSAEAREKMVRMLMEVQDLGKLSRYNEYLHEEGEPPITKEEMDAVFDKDPFFRNYLKRKGWKFPFDKKS